MNEVCQCDIIFSSFWPFRYIIDDSLQVTESDTVDIVDAALKHHSSDTTTQAMSLIALLKLSSRFPSCSEYVLDLFYVHMLLFRISNPFFLHGIFFKSFFFI